MARKLKAICERFLARSPRQAGWLPRSAAVASSADRQVPFAMRSKKALEHLCLRQIASRLQRLVPAAGQPMEALAVGKNF